MTAYNHGRWLNSREINERGTSCAVIIHTQRHKKKKNTHRRRPRSTDEPASYLYLHSACCERQRHTRAFGYMHDSMGIRKLCRNNRVHNAGVAQPFFVPENDVDEVTKAHLPGPRLHGCPRDECCQRKAIARIHSPVTVG